MFHHFPSAMFTACKLYACNSMYACTQTGHGATWNAAHACSCHMAKLCTCNVEHLQELSGPTTSRHNAPPPGRARRACSISLCRRGMCSDGQTTESADRAMLTSTVHAVASQYAACCARRLRHLGHASLSVGPPATANGVGAIPPMKRTLPSRLVVTVRSALHVAASAGAWPCFCRLLAGILS